MVFTAVHKFFPEEKGDRHPVLSERCNIVVIDDEAHRSQYDFIDGFGRHRRDALPQALLVGFTGTPIELEDADTRADEDGATVPIYHESRQARPAVDQTERPKIDPDFEEATESVDKRVRG